MKKNFEKKKKKNWKWKLLKIAWAAHKSGGGGGVAMDRQLDDITQCLVESLLASSKAPLKKTE